jgi:hypothetical protein
VGCLCDRTGGAGSRLSPPSGKQADRVHAKQSEGRGFRDWRDRRVIAEELLRAAGVLKAPLAMELRNVNRLFFTLRLPLSAAQPTEKSPPLTDAAVSTATSQQVS